MRLADSFRGWEKGGRLRGGRRSGVEEDEVEAEGRMDEDGQVCVGVDPEVGKSSRIVRRKDGEV